MRSYRCRQLVTLALLGTSTGLLAAENIALPFDRAYPEHVREGLLMPPDLKFSRRMAPLTGNGPVKEERPTFITADSMRGLSDVETVAEGNVELRKVGTVLFADHLTYRQEIDEVDAVGNVRLYQDQDVIAGPRLRLRVNENVGRFDEPRYVLQRTPKSGGAPTTGSGQAQRIDFEGEDRYRLSGATYSTCGPGNPDWYARADVMELDYTREVGEAYGVAVVFKDVPLLRSPWLTFPLNNKRRSGLLAPTFGTTSKSGVELTVPYYWAIAPDMDATIAPRVMTKRGISLNGEFRYLDHNYNGIIQGELLPDDRVKHARRSSYSLQHHQDLGRGLSGNLILNGVSDDTFFSDLSSRMSNIAQNNLLRQGILSYSGGWWTARAMAQSFQTLQDPALPPVAVPYRRLPQLTFHATRADLPLGGVLAFSGEYVNFTHPSQVEGQRRTLYPHLSLPLQTTAFFVMPKIGVHSTSYDLDRQAPGTPSHLSRTLPIFSIDSGVAFERKIEAFGGERTQTLEPRLFYLRVPNREQGLIPTFDTGLTDFNFAQIFSDNRYSGGDRVGDANQMTAALISRIIDNGSGAEILRGTFGQRYHFKPQQVILPGETPRINNTADFLAALSGQITSKVSADAGMQFNPHENQVDRFSVSARYQPELARVLSASYRYNRSPTSALTDVRQIDMAAQWPLGSGWSGVGRYNYSLADHRLIESVGGVEYDGGCWVSRVILQRIATATGDSSTAFFVQLELNGFSSIGSNPLKMLARNIPGYGRINQPAADPVFAGQ